MKKYAVIVAGGKGTRMQSEVPKQFLLLGGVPVLMRTLQAFYNYSKEITLLLGLPVHEIKSWEKIIKQYNFQVPHTIVEGGNSRFQTVKNCLHTIEGKGLVAIHDGVRPLISKGVISLSFQMAETHKSAVASISLKESLRKVKNGKNESRDRSEYRTIQTPQTFDLELIKEAYSVPEETWMTDDASVFEYSGHSVTLIEGHNENIKITTPSDLPVAEALLQLTGNPEKR